MIDVSKCIGCGKCADAYPSGAISMVPKELPPQQPHDDSVTAAMRALARAKTEQEALDDVRAEDGLKAKTRAFLAEQINMKAQAKPCAAGSRPADMRGEAMWNAAVVTAK